MQIRELLEGNLQSSGSIMLTCHWHPLDPEVSRKDSEVEETSGTTPWTWWDIRRLIKTEHFALLLVFFPTVQMANVFAGKSFCFVWSVFVFPGRPFEEKGSCGLPC